MSKVNLDAIIPREDFLTENKIRHPGGANPIPGFSVSDLKSEGHVFPFLRKPDFQRETSEWEPEKVCGLIESFVNEDLIPAVILWKSPGYTFVIDGSHRLSALAAWVNDDYGDGIISRKFYGNIPEQQEKIAKQTRSLIQDRVGDFRDYEAASKDPSSVKQEIAKRASSLPFTSISLQWLSQSTNAKKAESSFLKINKEAAPINPTELKLIECRNKPNGIAARATIRGGAGHQYWAKFPKEKREKIISLAKEINQMLFTPPYKDPIKTLDLPVGGKIYSAQTLPLIVDMINIVNGISLEKKIKKNVPQPTIADDVNGDETIKYLKNAKKIAMLINSIDPSSLGLHPAVYFYSREGRHKIASFYAIIALIMDFEKHRWFEKFLKIREKFENFLINNDKLVQQIVRKHRSASNGYLKIKDFYRFVLDLLVKGYSGTQLISEIIKNPDFTYLQTSNFLQTDDKDNFTKEKKSEAFIKEALKNALKCQYCKGYIHINSITVDHIKSKNKGGKGNIENAQLLHPRCNSIKN